MNRALTIAWPFVAGALIVAGAWWIYRPAGLIVAGLLMILDALDSRRKKPGA
jgi:hypothetical protein